MLRGARLPCGASRDGWMPRDRKYFIHNAWRRSTGIFAASISMSAACTAATALLANEVVSSSVRTSGCG
eukprot:6959190-Lingulodinium_polyedra.AAC.1